MSIRYNDWLLTCQPVIIATGDVARGCEINQTLRQAEDGRPILAVSLKHTTDMQDPGGMVLVPLGLDLWRGLYFEIDDYVSPNIGYNICLSVGCVGMFFVDPPLRDQLKSGEKAYLILYQLDVEAPIRVPLSLAGFDAAWMRLLALTQ